MVDRRLDELASDIGISIMFRHATAPDAAGRQDTLVGVTIRIGCLMMSSRAPPSMCRSDVLEPTYRALFRLQVEIHSLVRPYFDALHNLDIKRMIHSHGERSRDQVGIETVVAC